MLTKGDSVQFTTTLVTHQEPFCFCSVVTAAAYFIPPQRRRRKTQTLAILQQFSFFLVIIPVPTVTCMHAHTHTHHHTTCIYIILLTYSLSPSRREKSLPIRTIFPSMGTNKNDIFLCIHRHTQKLYNAVSSVAYRKRKETEKVAFPQHNSSSSWLSYSPQPPCSKNTVPSKCYCFFLIVSYNSYLSGFITILQTFYCFLHHTSIRQFILRKITYLLAKVKKTQNFFSLQLIFSD